MTAPIALEQIDETALLTIDDGKANAFNDTLIEAFHAALDRATADARAVAIVGRPGLLSGGFDLRVINGGDERAIARLVDGGARLLMRLYGHPQPVVVGATGHAVALGAFLLLAADHRIGTAGDFRIGLNETAVGLTLPAFGIALAQDRLSKRKLTQATVGATMYEPDAACDAGFLDELATPESLRDTVLERARALAALDGPAYAGSKVALRKATISRVMEGLS